jgi:transposase
VAAPKKYPDELRARAVRLYRESNPKPVIRRLAEQLGVHHEALRNWIRQDEADRGERDDRPTTDMLEENRRLREENLELRRANAILKPPACISPRSSTRPGGGHEVHRRTP